MRILLLLLMGMAVAAVVSASVPGGGMSAAAACSTTIVDDGVNRDIAYYVGLAFAIVFLILIFAYMIGTATNNTHILLFAKDEFFHLAISMVLVVAIAGVLYFSCTVVSSFLNFSLSSLSVGTSGCYSGDQSPREVAQCYMHTLENDARQTLQSATRESIDLEMDSAYVRGFYNPITGGIMTPTRAHKKTYSMQLDMVANTFVFPALISISLQRVVLDFLTENFIGYLIAIALFFRVMPPTRSMGNLFIALAIVLYIFLPSLYALNGAMDDVVFKGSTLGCNSIEQDINDRVMGDCNTPYNFWAIARFLPQAFFFPNLTIAITITFLSGINKALKVLT